MDMILYYKYKEGTITVFGVYVDDLLATWTKQNAFDVFFLK